MLLIDAHHSSYQTHQLRFSPPGTRSPTNFTLLPLSFQFCCWDAFHASFEFKCHWKVMVWRERWTMREVTPVSAIKKGKIIADQIQWIIKKDHFSEDSWQAHLFPCHLEIEEMEIYAKRRWLRKFFPLSFSSAAVYARKCMNVKWFTGFWWLSFPFF